MTSDLPWMTLPSAARMESRVVFNSGEDSRSAMRAGEPGGVSGDSRAAGAALTEPPLSTLIPARMADFAAPARPAPSPS